MLFTKPNLFQMWSNLSERRRHYFHVLTETDEIESVLFSLVAILRKPYFHSEEKLFDMRLVAKFAGLNHESLFSNLEALFIRALSDSRDYERLVQSEVAAGSKLSQAVSDTFLVNVFEFRLFGPWFSPAGDFLKRYLKWLDTTKFDYLTKEQLLSRHNTYSREWLKGCQFDGDGSLVATETCKILKKHILQFLRHHCHTSLERNIGLMIETDLFKPFCGNHPNDIRDALSISHVHPDLNTLGWPERNDRELFTLIDRVRRRLAAYLLLGGFVNQLPKSKSREFDEAQITEWLMNVSRTTSIQQARRLLDATQLDPDNVHCETVNYTDALKDLATHFASKGIKTALDGQGDKWILSLWWSATEDESRDSPTTKVFSSGIYEDQESGVVGSIGDLV